MIISINNHIAFSKFTNVLFTGIPLTNVRFKNGVVSNSIPLVAVGGDSYIQTNSNNYLATKIYDGSAWKSISLI